MARTGLFKMNMEQDLDQYLEDEVVHQPRRGNQHSSQWCHFLIFPFVASSPLQLLFCCPWFHCFSSPGCNPPCPICIYLYSIEGPWSRPTLSPTVHAFYCFIFHFLFSFSFFFISVSLYSFLLLSHHPKPRDLLGSLFGGLCLYHLYLVFY